MYNGESESLNGDPSMAEKTPADDKEPEAAWMTPEGRLKEIPMKDLDKGEKYTLEERHRLLQYWEHERVEEVAEWISSGAPRDSIPECVPTTTDWHVDLIMAATTTDVVFDLRGIPLGEYLATPRTLQLPRADLCWARLEHAYLGEAHLEHVDLMEAHLEHAELRKAHLEYANLFMAHLRYATLINARLEHANLNATHSEHAVLASACLQEACLVRAHLEDAVLFAAGLERADLHGARLKHANVCLAHLEYANLSGAHLERADLTSVHILKTDFTNVFLDDTIFRDVTWEGEGRRDPEATMFRGFDVRGIRYSDPLFDRWVKQANFVARVKTNWPQAWCWWNLTCKCGRSFGRWALVCGVIALFFGLVFCLAAKVFDYPLVQLGQDVGFERDDNPFTYLYFSVVTFTTLGFGDVRPTGLLGEILVTLEVILGYIGLGGLISIFTTKLIPPR